jgi:glycosyltransferase involved in cell wall biosynthesis
MKLAFGDVYDPQKSVTTTRHLLAGEVSEPSFNRRGTELLTVVTGEVTINGTKLKVGDVARVDTGEICQIAAAQDSKIISHIWPSRSPLVHEPFRTKELSSQTEIFDNLVSIIIVAKNIENHISHAIISCLNQTHRNIEVVVVDDGSVDNTAKKAANMAAFDHRVRVYSVSRGVNAARRFGLEQSKGTYFLLIDGDDWIDENSIEMLLETAKNLDSELVLCGYDHFNDKTAEVFHPIFPSEASRVDIGLPRSLGFEDAVKIARLNHTIWMNFFGVRVKERALEALPELSLYEDLPFALWLMQNAKNPALCNQPLYHYRRDRTGQSTEHWWAVKPAQKQTTLVAATEHILHLMQDADLPYYMILLYKLNEIVRYECNISTDPRVDASWKILRLRLFKMLPRELMNEIPSRRLRKIFQNAHRNNVS